MVHTRRNLFDLEINRIPGRARGLVKYSAGLRSEFAVLFMYPKANEQILAGGTAFGRIDYEVRGEGEMQAARRSLKIAIDVTFDYAVGGDALETPPVFFVTVSVMTSCQLPSLAW